MTLLVSNSVAPVTDHGRHEESFGCSVKGAEDVKIFHIIGDFDVELGIICPNENDIEVSKILAITQKNHVQQHQKTFSMWFDLRTGKDVEVGLHHPQQFSMKESCGNRTLDVSEDARRKDVEHVPIEFVKK